MIQTTTHTHTCVPWAITDSMMLKHITAFPVSLPLRFSIFGIRTRNTLGYVWRIPEPALLLCSTTTLAKTNLMSTQKQPV